MGGHHHHQAAAGSGAASSPSQPLLVSFGVVADLQHADIPDGTSFHGTARCG
jgi:hypothetical protein